MRFDPTSTNYQVILAMLATGILGLSACSSPPPNNGPDVADTGVTIMDTGADAGVDATPPDDINGAIDAPDALPDAIPDVQTVDVAPRGAWIELGPSPMVGGANTQVFAPVDRPQVGAVVVLAPHPTNADVLFAGSTNGGIWRTNNATAVTPSWTPLTDTAPSLSIGALSYDVADTTFQTLVAGIARTSNYAGAGGPLVGLLITRDGGATWNTVGTASLMGQNVSAVVMRNQDILAGISAVDPAFATPDPSMMATVVPGLARSTDGGATFTRVTSGLPAGGVRSIEIDPMNPTHVFVGLVGANAGIFRSDNFGGDFIRLNDATLDGVMNAANPTANVVISIHHSTAGGTVVWVGVVNRSTPTGDDGVLAGILRSTDADSSTAAATWTALAIPRTMELMGLVGIHPGKQGESNFSMVADPTNPNLVYVGGDRQPDNNEGGRRPPGEPVDQFSPPNSVGATTYNGRLFRGDASMSRPAQWTPITNNGADPDGAGPMPGTAPHADSRAMVFDAAGSLIECDDGGVYRRNAPTSPTGVWTSMVGNLRVSEVFSAAWDRNLSVAIAGAQDNGVAIESGMHAASWREVTGGDGALVAVDDRMSGSSVFYYSTNNLGGFSRLTLTDATQINPSAAHANALTINGAGGAVPDDGTVQWFSQIALNRFDSARLIVATARVYESADRGDTMTRLTAPMGTAVGAIVYGGRTGGTDNPDLLYVGLDSQLLLRNDATSDLTAVAGYHGSAILRIALDPEDSRTVFVCDDTNVYASRDAGATFTRITGDLSNMTLRTLEYIPSPGGDVVVAGSAGGVFATNAMSPGTWTRLGSGLPHTPINDLRRNGDVLVAGTLGRGVWMMPAVSSIAHM